MQGKGRQSHGVDESVRQLNQKIRIILSMLVLFTAIALWWTIPGLFGLSAASLIVTVLVGAAVGLYFAVISHGFKASFVISAIITSVCLALAIGSGLIGNEQSRFISAMGLMGVGVSMAEDWVFEIKKAITHLRNSRS